MLHEGNDQLITALQSSASGRRLLAQTTPLLESPLLRWCFFIPFGSVLVFMAVPGVERRGKKRARDSGVKASRPNSPGWSQIDERYSVDGTFRSALFGWNGVCEFTRKRFVPCWWDGGHFDVHPRYHGDVPRFVRDAVPSKGHKPKVIKAWFCPTLQFTQPVAVGDDNTNTDLSGYAQYSDD
jgi:hypothetical protein